jgi:hypothetical protein
MASDHDEFRSELAEYEESMAHKWDSIGYKLKQSETVKDLRSSNQTSKGKLSMIFDKWIEAPAQDLPVDWVTVVSVLRSKAVKLTALADRIEKEKSQSPRHVNRQRMDRSGLEHDGLSSATTQPESGENDSLQPVAPSQETPTSLPEQPLEKLVSPIQETEEEHQQYPHPSAQRTASQPKSQQPIADPQPQNEGSLLVDPGQPISLPMTDSNVQSPHSGPPPQQPLSLNPPPSLDDVKAARLRCLELYRQFKLNDRKYGLEAHQGQDYGQECISFKFVANLGKFVFRIVHERISENKLHKTFGTGFFVMVNGYHWILSCCHNFIKDRGDGDLLRDGKGMEVENIDEKIKERLLTSFLILPNDDFLLPERHKVPLTDFANVDTCHFYPREDICAVQCIIPDEYQDRVFPFELDTEQHEAYTPRTGDMFYIVQNPSRIPDDDEEAPLNKEVQFSMGLVWETEANDPAIGYDAVTYKGSSGSPIVFPSKDGLLLIGVHRKGGVQFNWGSLLPRDLVLTMGGFK